MMRISSQWNAAYWLQWQEQRSSIQIHSQSFFFQISATISPLVSPCNNFPPSNTPLSSKANPGNLRDSSSVNSHVASDGGHPFQSTRTWVAAWLRLFTTHQSKMAWGCRVGSSDSTGKSSCPLLFPTSHFNCETWNNGWIVAVVGKQILYATAPIHSVIW